MLFYSFIFWHTHTQNAFSLISIKESFNVFFFALYAAFLTSRAKIYFLSRVKCFRKQTMICGLGEPKKNWERWRVGISSTKMTSIFQNYEKKMVFIPSHFSYCFRRFAMKIVLVSVSVSCGGYNTILDCQSEWLKVFKNINYHTFLLAALILLVYKFRLPPLRQQIWWWSGR